MEYEKLYLKTFNEVHSNLENYIKNKLIESINKDYGFNEASKEVLEESEKKFETNKFNVTKPFTDLIYIFNKRNKYSKNINENILKRDVKPVFDNLNIKGYSFEELIKDLAEYYSEINIYRIFRNENTLYELIYKTEDLSEFEIKEYDSGQEHTNTLMKYKKLAFPDSKDKTENINFVEKMNIPDYNINDIDNNSLQNNETKPLNENTSKINLTNEENCIIIFLFKSILLEGGFTSDTELCKVISLIQIKQISEFGSKDSFRSSKEYIAIRGKINNINLKDISKNNKQLLKEYYSILKKLSNKIKSQKLKNINSKIKILIDEIETQIK